MNKLVASDVGHEGALIIAEVAQAHEGSVGMAHAFIDAAARCGADGVKFQTHIAEAESTKDEPWRVAFSQQDATRFDYWKRMEFSEAQWGGLRDHAAEAGLLFLSTPFSPEAVDLLNRVGVVAWKVASGEVTTPDILQAVAGTGLPVWISSGMSTFAEIEAAVEVVRGAGLPFAVLQCTSVYPTPPELWGLNVIDELRARFGCPVGLSDHSGSIYAGLAAAARGIDLLEVHLTLSRDMFGPDVEASLTPEELTQLVTGVRIIERANRNPVDKDGVAERLSETRRTFTKSLVATRNLEAGTVLGRDHLAMKKAGMGIPAVRIDEVVGRRLRRDVTADTALQAGDLT